MSGSSRNEKDEIANKIPDWVKLALLEEVEFITNQLEILNKL